jgi:thioredoxin 2
MSTTESASTTESLTIPCSSCGQWNRVTASRAASGPTCGTCKSALRLDQPLHLDDASFDRVIASTTVPVLVDFYADWCGPCKMMAPAVDTLASETVGTALVAKLDTENAPLTARRFRIRGIPAVIVFRGGREVKRTSGAMPLGALRAMLRN